MGPPCQLSSPAPAQLPVHLRKCCCVVCMYCLLSISVQHLHCVDYPDLSELGGLQVVIKDTTDGPGTKQKPQDKPKEQKKPADQPKSGGQERKQPATA